MLVSLQKLGNAMRHILFVSKSILATTIMYIAGLRSRYLQYLPPKVTSDLESMGSVTKFLDHKIRSKGIFGLLSPLSITHLHNPARLLCKCYLLGVL